MRIHCYTSISFSYLSRARTLAETLRALHPEWVLWLCISDLPPAESKLAVEDEPFDGILYLKAFPIPDLDRWVFKHNVIELCTAIKGYAANYLFDQGADIVVYIDPDIAVFESLSPVIEAATRASIILTPHLVDPEITAQAVWENERSALLHGVYNLGFIAIQNSIEGRRCATWWQDRLANFCYESVSEGIYTDQRWCDLIPAFFDEVLVLRDPGFNVASWNLSQRKLSFSRSGKLLSNGQPLRFYHFTKVDKVGRLMIDRNMGESLVVLELIKWYEERLEANKFPVPKGYWHYGYYSDGTPVSYDHRVLYRTRRDLQEAFPQPLSAAGYLSWLKSHHH